MAFSTLMTSVSLCLVTNCALRHEIQWCGVRGGGALAEITYSRPPAGGGAVAKLN
jgi:hypothetical protein